MPGPCACGRPRGAGGKLLLITDGWRPQVNGVVTAFEHMKRELEKHTLKVVVIHPALFRNIRFPLYPEIRLAIPEAF
jgi:hypothetical protein